MIILGIVAAYRGIAIHSSADCGDGDEVDERVMSAVNPFGGVECSASGIFWQSRDSVHFDSAPPRRHR
jgi:hypothetical protein